MVTAISPKVTFSCQKWNIYISQISSLQVHLGEQESRHSDGSAVLRASSSHVIRQQQKARLPATGHLPFCGLCRSSTADAGSYATFEYYQRSGNLHRLDISVVYG